MDKNLLSVQEISEEMEETYETLFLREARWAMLLFIDNWEVKYPLIERMNNEKDNLLGSKGSAS